MRIALVYDLRDDYRALGFSETIRVPGYYRGRESALRMIRMLRVARLPQR